MWVNDLKNVNSMILSIMEILKERGDVIENEDIVFLSGVMDV